MFTAFGLLILALPIFAILFFKDKLRAIFYIVSSFFIFHFISSFILQYFSVFTYQNLVSVNIIYVLALAFYIFKSKRQVTFSRPSFYFILTFLLIFIQLWSVHYNYSGTVRTLIGTQEVLKSSYSYPVFSDEWVAAALMKYSIENRSLPLVNPFDQNKPFVNLLFPFHTLSTGIFLVLSIDPVLDFAFLPILLGMSICIVMYALLRKFNVGEIPSLIATLFVPLIAQASNLPGIWTAIPFIVGVLFLLLYIGGLIMKDRKIYTSGSIFSVLFYPPIIVFILPIFVVYFWKEKQKILLLFCFITLLILAYPSLLSFVFRPNLDGGLISFPIFSVIPLILLPAILCGLFLLCRDKKYFAVAPVITGFLYWLFYSLYPEVIIIEYPRVVMISSILSVFVGGIGLNIIQNTLSKKYLASGIFAVFVFITLYYPIGDSWQNFVLLPTKENDRGILMAYPLISRHLNQDDLALFKNLKKEVFLAPPWKSLVLATATDNIPLVTKPSTIAVSKFSYHDFMSKSCAGKKKTIDRYKIKYLYSAYNNCSDIELVGKSQEGLFLYKVNKNN